MALTDIITYEGEPMIYDMSRGNTGIVEDIQSEKYNTIEIPQILAGGGEGNIFIMSE